MSDYVLALTFVTPGPSAFFHNTNGRHSWCLEKRKAIRGYLLSCPRTTGNILHTLSRSPFPLQHAHQPRQSQYQDTHLLDCPHFHSNARVELPSRNIGLQSTVQGLLSGAQASRGRSLDSIVTCRVVEIRFGYLAPQCTVVNMDRVGLATGYHGRIRRV